ncbi:MAG: hypothetical protein MESAZ_00060 [Saezia sanguinis]
MHDTKDRMHGVWFSETIIRWYGCIKKNALYNGRLIARRRHVRMGHFSITQAGRSFLLVPESGSRKENGLHTDFDFDMSQPACPVCSLNDVLDFPDHYECATCGHEWEREDKASDAARIVKDANGNVLADGDSVTLIKDLKLRGSSEVIKQGTKVRSIRLVDGDHEIDCKVDGVSMALKACFVKKA